MLKFLAEIKIKICPKQVHEQLFNENFNAFCLLKKAKFVYSREKELIHTYEISLKCMLFVFYKFYNAKIVTSTSHNLTEDIWSSAIRHSTSYIKFELPICEKKITISTIQSHDDINLRIFNHYNLNYQCPFKFYCSVYRRCKSICIRKKNYHRNCYF